MRITSGFTVDAPPEQVFAYLLDAGQVVGCVPGAELAEVVDASTFRGKLKVKVGAVQVTYQGSAHILDTDEGEDHVTVRLEAQGKEVGGQGSVRAKMALTVARTDGGGSEVGIDTDFTVTGRIAQFGRGVIEDVSKRLVGQMATCISANLEEGNTRSITM